MKHSTGSVSHATGEICTVVHGDDLLSVPTTTTRLVGHKTPKPFRHHWRTSCWPSEAGRSEFRTI